MIFRLMLFFFGIGMKMAFMLASLKDKAFKNRIKDKKFIIQVKMRDTNKGRYYMLDKGKITSKGQIAPESPGMLIEWKDAGTALKTLLKFKPKALYESVSGAVTAGNLAVEVEYAQSYAFFETMKDMGMVYAGFLPIIKKIPGTKLLLG